jgi:purine-binding chemotaxis protein CheW
MNRARRQFDWQAIHGALERRLSHLGSTIEDDAQRVDALLRERSLALAATPRAGRSRQQLTPTLAFRVGAERFGLPLAHAQEVTGLTRAALLPGAGPSIVGIIAWRGEFVVVFDLASLLGVAPTENSADRRAIILRGEEPRLALAVDAVDEVIHVDPAAMQAPEQLRVRRAELFRGATTDAVLVLAEEPLLARLGKELRAA